MSKIVPYVCVKCDHVWNAVIPSKPFGQVILDKLDEFTYFGNPAITGSTKGSRALALKSGAARAEKYEKQTMRYCPKCRAYGMPLRFCDAPQVAAWLASRVDVGELPPGKRISPGQPLPSADEIFISEAELYYSGTVEAALKLLAEKGVLVEKEKRYFITQ